MKKRDGRMLPPLKVQWIYQEPTKEQAREIQRELDKLYFPIFDDIWEEMKESKESGNHL